MRELVDENNKFDIFDVVDYLIEHPFIAYGLGISTIVMTTCVILDKKSKGE